MSTELMSRLYKHREAATLWVIKTFKFPRETAEDMVTDALMKAHLTSHPPNKKHERSWFFTVVRNTSLNHIRSIRGKKKDRKFISLDNLMDIEDPSTPPDEMVVHRRKAAEVIKEIERLPPRQCLSFQLRVMYGMNFHEIGDVMDCGYDTAKANYRHALVKILDLVQPVT